MNKVILVGHIGRDPDVRTTDAGNAVANLSLATREWNSRDNREVAEWHRLVAFGARAEFARDYLRKGSAVAVDGKLQTRKWTDKDGVTRYTTEVIVWQIEFAGSKPKDEPARQEPAQQAPRDEPTLYDEDDEYPF